MQNDCCFKFSLFYFTLHIHAESNKIHCAHNNSNLKNSKSKDSKCERQKVSCHTSRRNINQKKGSLGLLAAHYEDAKMHRHNDDKSSPCAFMLLRPQYEPQTNPNYHSSGLYFFSIWLCYFPLTEHKWAVPVLRMWQHWQGTETCNIINPAVFLYRYAT